MALFRFLPSAMHSGIARRLVPGLVQRSGFCGDGSAQGQLRPPSPEAGPAGRDRAARGGRDYPRRAADDEGARAGGEGGRVGARPQLPICPSGGRPPRGYWWREGLARIGRRALAFALPASRPAVAIPSGRGRRRVEALWRACDASPARTSRVTRLWGEEGGSASGRRRPPERAAGPDGPTRPAGAGWGGAAVQPVGPPRARAVPIRAGVREARARCRPWRSLSGFAKMSDRAEVVKLADTLL